jgi:hypothetical protein
MNLDEKVLKYKNECGCKMGAQFMAIALFISVFLAINRFGFISLGFLLHLPHIVLITLFSSGIGKFIGILHAKYKYKSLTNSKTKLSD